MCFFPLNHRQRFDHLYGVNERLGSFYLQSKIFRAKERLELELPEDVRAQVQKEEAERQAAQAQASEQDEKMKNTGE